MRSGKGAVQSADRLGAVQIWPTVRSTAARERADAGCRLASTVDITSLGGAWCAAVIAVLRRHQQQRVLQ